MYRQLEACRICSSRDLQRVLDLGEQTLTGVFPATRDQVVTAGPLRLVKCMDVTDGCGLLQLDVSYDLGEMYGDNYGYRSGLNTWMVNHLRAKVERICTLVTLRADDLVIDIGANDATTLRNYDEPGLTLVGIDPTGDKFRQYYPDHVQLIPDFFSGSLVEAKFPGRKAKVVTSFSMFYDLESPLTFMREVSSILADDGVWVCEQSYMPAMLATNSYDTVCHEHLEFYALRQIQWMAERSDLRILDVEFNDANGGSFSVTFGRATADTAPLPAVQAILDREMREGLDTLAPYHAFAERVAASRTALLNFLQEARARGETVAALGASTKGNVLLQYCGLTSEDLMAVGEVNPDKYGHFTPGSLIPIISEDELLATKPDHLIVLPWHFREFFESSAKFADAGLVFPLPELSAA